MSRISERFSALKQAQKGAFIPYVEAGDPDYETAMAILKAMPDAGADLIEIGMPFSDPMADGPTVQAAANRALKAGANMKKTLQMVTEFRKQDQNTPIILMGYTNPVEHYGYERFCENAAKAGADGLILVDMPFEEMDNIKPYAQKHGIDIIHLVAPTTSPQRLKKILKDATGFVYYVSIAGITGTKTATIQALQEAIPQVRAATDLPIAIGFGLSTPEHIASALTVADAAVVASALLKTLESTLDQNQNPTSETITKVIQHTKRLAAGKQNVHK